MPQIADILLSLGPYRLSELIARSTQEIPGDAFSHAALVIAEAPLPLIIESVPPRTRVYPYNDALLHVEHAVLLQPRTLSVETRVAIAKKALEFEGALYGVDRFLGGMLDAWLDTDWCTQHLYLSKRFPWCSVLVAAAYDAQGLDFGEPAQGVMPAEIFAFAKTHPHLYSIIEVV